MPTSGQKRLQLPTGGGGHAQEQSPAGREQDEGLSLPSRTRLRGAPGSSWPTRGQCGCAQARGVWGRGRERDQAQRAHRLLVRLEARGAAPVGGRHTDVRVPVPARGHAPPPVGRPRPRQVRAAAGAPPLWRAQPGVPPSVVTFIPQGSRGRRPPQRLRDASGCSALVSQGQRARMALGPHPSPWT